MAGNQGVAYKKVQHVPAALEKQPPTRPPSAANVFNRSAAPIIDMREVYFLVAHFLSSGPCVKAAELLKQELREHDLLPRRGHAFYSNSGVPSELVGDNGRTLSVPYEEVAARHPSISQDHLRRLLLQLMHTTAADHSPPDSPHERTLTVASANTILGTGPFSLLEKERAASLQQKALPKWLRWPNSQAGHVLGAMLREIGGGFSGPTNRLPARKAGEYALAHPVLLVERLERLSTLRGHRNAVYCTVFDRSGRLVVTGSDDFLVKIWSMNTGILLRTCRGHTGDITDLTVSADNKFVASGSNDHSIRIWSLPFGNPISVLKGHANPVTAVQFSPRPGFEHQLLSASEDNTCRIWDARSSQVKPQVYMPRPLPGAEKAKTAGKDEILAASYNPDGRFFVTGSTDKMARVWSTPTLPELYPLYSLHEIDTLAGHEDLVNFVQFSGCNTAIAPEPAFGRGSAGGRMFNVAPLASYIVSCSKDGSAIIWMPKKTHSKTMSWVKAHILKVPEPPIPPTVRGLPRHPLPTPRGVNMIVWSLDNRFVLAAIMDCRICVWNARDGTLVHSLNGHTDATYVLDVHPTDPRVALSAGYDGRLIIWDIRAGRPLRTFQQADLQLVDARFSPDGTAIIASNEIGEVYYYATGTPDQHASAAPDQFFLGDYLPTVEDVNGYVQDQTMDIPVHLRNLQDPLCNAQMEPYPEPWQSSYQTERARAFGGAGALLAAELPVPMARMPTPNVIFAAQAAAAQPLRHHVWTSHHADGPRLEPAPLPPPLAQAPRQPTVFRDDFEGDGEEGGEDDDSGSVSDSDDDGGAGRATRRGLRPSSRRGRGLSDGGESSGGYGRRARGDEEAPSTSRFGRVIKRKRDDDYESLPEGRHDERHPRPATRQQRRPPKDDDDWEDGSETPPSSSDEEGSEEPGRRPSRRRPSASKGKGVSEDETAPGGSYVGGTDEGAARLMAWSGGVDIGGIPEGGRLGLASGGVPLWAGKKKRGATRGHGGARNAEGGGLPGGPMEGLAAGGQTGDDVHSGPSDGGSGRSVVRLGGVNDFRGVQFRSVLNGTAESGAAQGKEGGAVGEAFQRKALGGPENQGLGNVGNQSPGGSCFGVSAQPGPGSAKKEQAGGSAAKAGPGSDGKKKIVRIRIIPPKEKVGSHPMSPPQMPAPINTPRDRSGGVEDKGGADGAETGRAGELEAGESRRSMQTPETDPNWPRLGAKASPVSKTFTGMGQPTGAQLDGGALFRPQFAPPIGQFPLGQPLAGNVPDAGPKKAKKGPAKPNKNKGAGSLAAAAPMTGPGGQQPGSAAALAAGLGAGFLGVSGASGGAPARPGHQLNQQGLMPNPAGYPLDPHAPPPNPSAGYRLNHQGPMQESVVQHLQTLQTLVSQAESNRASDGSSSLAPLQWAAQNPAFSNPPVAPKPVLAPAVRGAQNPAPSTLQTLLNLEKQQRMHGLPVSQTPQGLNTAPMYTQFRPSYAPMTNRQTGLSAGFGSGDPAGFRSLPSAPTPSSGPVLEQGLPIRRVETRQPAPQQGLRNQWQQQPSIQGLTFTVRPQTDHSQVWRGPVNAIPAPQAEGFRRAPDTFDPALTDFVYPPNQGGYAERPNHSVVLPNQGGYQQTTGYSDARWGASGGSGGGFAAHFPQDGYQKHGAIPGQLRQVAYQGSQQTVPVGSVNPTAHLSSLLGLPSGTGALQAEGGEHW